MSRIELERGLKLSLNDRAVFKEVLEMFIEDVADITEESMLAKDNDSLKRQMHSLKGVGSNLGLISFSEACNELEKYLTDNPQADESGKSGLIKNMMMELEASVKAAANWS